MYCGTGWGFCQALFLGWQTDTDADADVYCINTIDIYRGGGGGFGSDIFRLAGQLDSRGVSMREQVLVFCSHGVKVRKQVYVRRCGDTFHPPEKLTLYLKVTPFDSNTPTHLSH